MAGKTGLIANGQPRGTTTGPDFKVHCLHLPMVTVHEGHRSGLSVSPSSCCAAIATSLWCSALSPSSERSQYSTP